MTSYVPYPVLELFYHGFCLTYSQEVILACFVARPATQVIRILFSRYNTLWIEVVG